MFYFNKMFMEGLMGVFVGAGGERGCFYHNNSHTFTIWSLKSAAKLKPNQIKGAFFLRILKLTAIWQLVFFSKKILGGAKGGRNFMKFFLHIFYIHSCVS